MKIICLFLLMATVINAIPTPDEEEEKPPEEEAAKPEEESPKPEEGAANPEDGAAKEDDGAAKGDDGAEKGDDGAEKQDDGAEKQNDSGAVKVNDDTEKDSTAGNFEVVDLTLGPDDTTPANVYTSGGGLKVNSMRWKTYYTRPATKPGCMCVTRGPLSSFKLHGNIHFPRIKVTPERYVTVPTEATSTMCPPCDCSHCSKPQMDIFFKR